MFDLTAAGEVVIDFTPAPQSTPDRQLFSKNPGGAPANLLAMASSMGARTRMFAKVGKDAFGDFLLQSMRECGVDCGGVSATQRANTTLAFVELDSQGERSFTFCRKPGADTLLQREDIPTDALADTRLFHFSGVSLTGDPARTAVLDAARRSRGLGVPVSFDPNYRPFLWPDSGAARAAFDEALALADILKVSEEEAAFYTGEPDPEQAARLLLGRGPALVLLTRGRQGSVALTSRVRAQAPAYRVNALDTTGAGDAFLGAVLQGLCGETVPGLHALSEERLLELLKTGAAAGAIITTRYGAMAATPSRGEVEALVRDGSLR